MRPIYKNSRNANDTVHVGQNGLLRYDDRVYVSDIKAMKAEILKINRDVLIEKELPDAAEGIISHVKCITYA